ncbi:YraN family protein [bacterium]|nr:YraN family protein [bacterium]
MKAERGKKIQGFYGEEAARKYLRNSGWEIVDTNVCIYSQDRSRKILGEIDIIASDGQTLIFAEVKWRKDHSFGSPLEAVNARKQNKLRILAELYMLKSQRQEKYLRFDVIGITGSGKNMQLQHIINAF